MRRARECSAWTVAIGALLFGACHAAEAPVSKPANAIGTPGGATALPVEPPPAAGADRSPPSPSVPPSGGLVAPAPAPAPTSTVATTKTAPAWASCHRSARASAKDVAKDVGVLAGACEKATGMKLLGKTLAGKQADQDRPQAFSLDAKANHCYRVYAQADQGIQDLDVAITDSAGVVVAQDATDDPSPVVLEDGAVCFKQDDKASVVVSVGMGSGAYAVQIWQD